MKKYLLLELNERQKRNEEGRAEERRNSSSLFKINLKNVRCYKFITVKVEKNSNDSKFPETREPIQQRNYEVLGKETRLVFGL